MKGVLKSAIVGTPLESFVRALRSRIRYYAAPRHVRMNRMYNAQTVAVMSRILRPNSHCIDVGCSRGTVLKEIMRIAPGGSHFAFEPLPQYAAQLRKDYPGVSIHELALSDTAGTARFNFVTEYPGRSGLRKRTYPSDSVDIQEITVRTERLDNVIPQDREIAFMKIDVEGAEYQVVAGGLDTIRRDKPFIVFEHGIGGSDHYGTSPEMMYDILRSADLQISIMADWLAGRPALSRQAFVRQYSKGPNWYFLAHR